ncbi:MAG TPA: MoxR family ATPase [Micromonospora sp.]
MTDAPTDPPRVADPGPGADWRIYRATGRPHDGIERLPPPPRWRRFEGGPVVSPRLTDGDSRVAEGRPDRGRYYQATDEVIELVNAALYLRRPLLVTGKPGTGKSSLAHSIAYELKLGPVLYWSITSRSNLREGLYEYDAIGRLQETNLHRPAGGDATVDAAGTDIGRYIELGPLGTALLPQLRPRVLLVDELDKSDIDLPNDLLNVFEEGRFDIPELARLPDEQSSVQVMIHDGTDRVAVHRGRVCCRAFPVVVITSNGEREFPPAFLRRCVRLDIKPPDPQALARIVADLVGGDGAAERDRLIAEFVERRERGDLATDQLLNALYLVTTGLRPPPSTSERLVEALLRQLDQGAVG